MAEDVGLMILAFIGVVSIGALAVAAWTTFGGSFRESDDEKDDGKGEKADADTGTQFSRQGSLWPDRDRIRQGIGRLALRILGRPEAMARRLLYLGLFLGVLAIAMSAFLIVGANVSVSAESGPILRSIARLLTDFRLYALAAIVAMLVVRAAFWDILAGVTSRLTPYSKRAVKRYHSEVLSTDGTVRLIGTGDHSEDQLVAKLRRATNPDSDVEDEVPHTSSGERDDGPVAAIDDDREPVAAIPAEFDGTGGEGRDSDTVDGVAMASPAPLLTDVERLDEEIDALADELDALRDELLAADLDPDNAAESLLKDEGPVAPFDLMAEADRALVDEFETTLDTYEQALDRRERLYQEAEAALDAKAVVDDGNTIEDDSEAWGVTDDPTGGGRDASPGGTALRDGDRGVGGASAVETTADPGSQLRQHVQTFLLDFATAANADDLVWRFLLPSGVVAALTFVVLQRLWFHPVVYVAIGAGSLVVGGLYYSGVKWRRRRRLSAAREAPDTGGSGQTACLVKYIQIHGDSAPDAYVAWMGGHVYFSMDRTRFCNKVADRWWHRIHNRAVPPAIEERFAHNARMMLPTTYQTEFADSVEGRAAIQDELVDVVREAENPDGMVPKHALGEKVVDAGGRFGHDPDLVAEEYAHLHGAALAELDVSLENAAGERSGLTVVHLRTGGVLHDLAEIRATFAAEFDPDAEARFSLPDVGDLAPRWDIEMGDLRPLEGAKPDADATEDRTVSPVGAAD
jgi:hypothetical protein